MDKALPLFFQRYQQAHDDRGLMPQVEHDDQWPSPCERGTANDGWIPWEIHERGEPGDFSGLERALELTLHKDVKAYFGRYFAANMNAKTDRGELQLLQPWNDEDFDRLLENLIGHVLMKRRLDQPETLFVALTDEDDWIISILNDTGEVVLERIGQVHTEVLSPDIETFLQSLTPIVE